MTGDEAVFLGLGANLGNRAANLAMALRYVSSLARVDAVSSLYETAPVGGDNQPSFYNAVCRLSTGLSPEALLDYLKRVEFEIGRRPARALGPAANRPRHPALRRPRRRDGPARRAASATGGAGVCPRAAGGDCARRDASRPRPDRRRDALRRSANWTSQA